MVQWLKMTGLLLELLHTTFWADICQHYCPGFVHVTMSILPSPSCPAAGAATPDKFQHIGPVGCSITNEPHEPHETCPAPCTTRVSVGFCGLPPASPGPSNPALPAALSIVMVHLHMSLCLGNKVPLSQLGHCPWSLLCGELATQLRAR